MKGQIFKIGDKYYRIKLTFANLVHAVELKSSSMRAKRFAPTITLDKKTVQEYLTRERKT